MSETFSDLINTQGDLPCTYIIAVRAQLDGWSPDAEGALWDELRGWCEVQQLFLGGSPEAAAIFSFDPLQLQRQSHLLRNLLLSRLDEKRFLLEMTNLSRLDSPKMRLAAITALTSAQRFLFDRAAESTHALEALTSSAAVRPLPKVSQDGMRLDVTLPLQQLVIELQRLDGQPEPKFERFRSGIRPGELHGLIGEFLGSQWQAVPPVADLWRGDWTANSGPWRIYVRATGEAVAAEHSDVMRRLNYLLAYE